MGFDHATILKSRHIPGPCRHVIFMGDENQGDPLAVQVIKEIKDFRRGGGIQGSCRFIRQQKSGAVDDRPCNRHPLLLSS